MGRRRKGCREGEEQEEGRSGASIAGWLADEKEKRKSLGREKMNKGKRNKPVCGRVFSCHLINSCFNQ